MSIDFSDVAYDEGYNKGYEEGLTAGRTEGAKGESNMSLEKIWEEGYMKGRSDGYSDGYQSGKYKATATWRDEIGRFTEDALGQMVDQLIHQYPISLELRKELEKYLVKFTTKLQVDDIVRFTDNNNPPFKITKIDEEKGWAWGVAQDGMTYAGVELSRLEKVTA